MARLLSCQSKHALKETSPLSAALVGSVARARCPDVNKAPYKREPFARRPHVREVIVLCNVSVFGNAELSSCIVELRIV